MTAKHIYHHNRESSGAATFGWVVLGIILLFVLWAIFSYWYEPAEDAMFLGEWIDIDVFDAPSETGQEDGVNMYEMNGVQDSEPDTNLNTTIDVNTSPDESTQNNMSTSTN